MGEIDLLLFLVPFIHRKIDNPTELEAALVDESQLLADLGPRRPRKFHEVLWLAGDEETGVADAELHLIGDLLGALRTDIFGQRARTALLAFAPEDVTETGLT